MTAAGSVPPEAVAVQRAGAALSLPERATTKVDARDDGERPRRVVCPRSFASPFATPSHWLGGGHVSAVIATSRMNCAGCERSRACGSHRSRRGVASPACFASRACIFFFFFAFLVSATSQTRVIVYAAIANSCVSQAAHIGRAIYSQSHAAVRVCVITPSRRKDAVGQHRKITHTLFTGFVYRSRMSDVSSAGSSRCVVGSLSNS